MHLVAAAEALLSKKLGKCGFCPHVLRLTFVCVQAKDDKDQNDEDKVEPL